MDTARKIRIGLGAGIILIGALTHAEWWIAGIFPLVIGIFNFCPACNSSNGASCEINRVKPIEDPTSKE